MPTVVLRLLYSVNTEHNNIRYKRRVIFRDRLYYTTTDDGGGAKPPVPQYIIIIHRVLVVLMIIAIYGDYGRWISFLSSHALPDPAAGLNFLGSSVFVVCFQGACTVIVGFVKCPRFSFNIKKINKIIIVDF